MGLPQGMEFLVTGQWYGSGRGVKCTKYPLKATWRDACVPGLCLLYIPPLNPTCA